MLPLDHSSPFFSLAPLLIAAIALQNCKHFNHDISSPVVLPSSKIFLQHARTQVYQGTNVPCNHVRQNIRHPVLIFTRILTHPVLTFTRILTHHVLTFTRIQSQPVLIFNSDASCTHFYQDINARYTHFHQEY